MCHLLPLPDDDSLVMCSSTHFAFLLALSNDSTKFRWKCRLSVLGRPAEVQAAEKIAVCHRIGIAASGHNLLRPHGSLPYFRQWCSTTPVSGVKALSAVQHAGLLLTEHRANWEPVAQLLNKLATSDCSMLDIPVAGCTTQPQSKDATTQRPVIRYWVSLQQMLTYSV